MFVIRILINKIGLDGFGLYSIYLSITAGYIALCGCAGPAITRRASSCSSKEIPSLLVSSLCATFIASLGIQVLFFMVWAFANDRFPAATREVISNSWSFLILGFLFSIVSVSDYIRLGLAKNHVNNILGIFINASQIYLTYLLCEKKNVSIEILAMIYFVPPVVIKLFSFIGVVRINDFFICQKIRIGRSALTLLHASLKFSLGVLSGFISVNLMLFAISKSGDVELVAVFTLLTKYIGLIGGMLFMFTTPLWPTIHKKIKSNDAFDALKLYKQYGSIFLLYIFLACFLSMFFLNDILYIWTGEKLEYPLVSRVLFSAYMCFYLISHVLYIGLLTLDASLKLTLPAMIESLIAFSIVFLYGIDAGLNSILLILLITNIAIVICSYTYFFYVDIKNLKIS